MTHGMEDESASNGCEAGGSTKPVYTLSNDCDILPKDWDQNLMACVTGQRSQRMLRSVSRSHYNDRSKRIKINSDDTLIDSDNENALVIDIDRDSSTEDNKPTKDSEGEDSQEKKYTLRPKAQNNGLVNWKSFDEILNLSEESSLGKEESLKLEEKWLQIPKPKKKGKLKKPLKRLARQAKPVELNSTISLKELDDDDYDEKDTSDSSGQNYKCPICQEQFIDAHSFTVHIREHNTDKTSHVCMICSKQLCSASSLDRHMFVHSGERPFPCKICKFRFTTNGNMNRHMKTHKLLQEKDDKKSTKLLKRLYDGKMKEETRASSDGTPENSDAGEIYPSTQNSLSCRVCGKGFLSPASLQKHMKLHTNDPIKCHSCFCMFENYYIYSKHSCEEGSSSKPIKTKIGFYDLTFLEFTSPKFPLVAKYICEKQMRDPSSFHFSYECNTCSKAFPSNLSLRKHEEAHLNGDLTCNTCRIDLPNSVAYRLHQLKHRVIDPIDQSKSGGGKEDYMVMLGLCDPEIEVQKDVKPKLKHFNNLNYFVSTQANCELIESSPAVSNDLADVKSIVSLASKAALPDLRASPVMASPASPVHAVTGDVPLSPVIEGSVNPLLDQLNTNKDASLPEEASKVIGVAAELAPVKPINIKSIRTISKKIPKKVAKGGLHKCLHCPYKSVDKSTLKRHFRKHSGEHPFKCSICDYVFTTKANGHRHVKNKHSLHEQEASDAIIYNPNMQEGTLGESPPETVCKYCGIDFKYNRVLRHHLRSLNNSCRYKPFYCEICKTGFSTKNNCIRHICQRHPEKRTKARELALVKEARLPLQIVQQQAKNQDVAEDDTSEGDNLSQDPPDSDLSANNEVLPVTENCIDTVKEDEMKDVDSPAAVIVESSDYPGSDAEMVSVAESLVSLRGMDPIQDMPLDLTMCALNLSKRAEAKDMRVSQTAIDPSATEDALSSASPLSQTENQRSASNMSESVSHEKVPLDLSQKPDKKKTSVMCLISDFVSNKSASYNGNSIPIMCLPQILTSVNGAVMKQSLPVLISTPRPVPAVPMTPEVGTSTESAKSTAKEKLFFCDICSRGFTLKSNRERHIKNHHPERARPPRSRNFIPTLTSSTIQKQNNSTLSDKTRDALRIALISKSTSTTSKNSPSAAVAPFTTSMLPLPLKNNGEAPSCLEQKNDIPDLSSVSDVIDAVNCQPFKDYLNKANEVNESQANDNARNGMATNISMKGDSKKKGKRSSYAKCTKNIACTFCNRKFPWKSSLSRHFLTHTGLKPHKCFMCPISFTTKSNRDRHLFKQHKDYKGNVDLSAKPYHCNYCPDSHFSTKNKLKKHQFLKHSQKPSESNLSYRFEDDSSVSPTKQDLSELESVDGTESSSFSDDPSDGLDCHICGNTFKGQHDLLTHLTEIHARECSSPDDLDAIKAEPGDTYQGATNEQSRLDNSDIISLEPTNCRNSNTPFLTKNCDSPSMNNSTPKIIPNLPKISTHPLLYLFAAAEHARSINDANENRTVEPPVPRDNENSLIQDLLGLKDPGFIDEMLDSAVRSQIKQEKNT